MPHSSGSGVPRALCSASLSTPEPEDGALQANGRQRDAELVEQHLLRHDGDLVGRASLDEVAQHRHRGLADGASAPVEADLLDDVAVTESHRDEDLVAAERILTLGMRIRGIQQTVVPRVLVVVEDELAVELIEFGHGYPSDVLAFWRPSTRRSISSGIE